MSRHKSRKERWTQVNAKEYRAPFGLVQYKAGAWEGIVQFEQWYEEAPEWRAEQTYVGRFKRPRNAMIAVEDKAREILRREKEKVKVEIDD